MYVKLNLLFLNITKNSYFLFVLYILIIIFEMQSLYFCFYASPIACTVRAGVSIIIYVCLI